ncbi:hypothetical protein ACOSQ4_032975 [Xanthoceras sorbifolium]
MYCPTCFQIMNYTVSYVSPTAGVGFVKGSSITYITMDNLEFMPMSTELFVTLLKKFKNKEVVGAPKEIDVNFGMKEVLKLLKASMECKTVFSLTMSGNRIAREHD